jgi:conjugal transfer/entry exclusion protein
MAIQCRYEKFHQTLAGTITVEALIWNSLHPNEQTTISVEFADGTTVNQIETKIQNYASIVGNLTRNT